MGRDAAKLAIEGFGGKVVSSVSNSTDYLISDGKERGAKAKKAEELGTPILDEDAFLKMLESAKASGGADLRAPDAGKAAMTDAPFAALGEANSSKQAHPGSGMPKPEERNQKKYDLGGGNPQMELPL